MITFAYPWCFGILPLPLLAWWLLPPYVRTTTALRVPFLDRVARQTGQDAASMAITSRRGLLATISLCTVWCCLVTSLARPQKIEPPISRTVPVRDMLLAIDLSGSMETKDFQDAQGNKVDRLTAVKQILDGFLSRRKGDRVGLIVFGNAPFVQAPFTQDLEVCRQLLAETRLGMAGPKTAMGDAIGLAVTVFERSQVPERLLIILTDGNDTGSLIPPQKAAEIAHDKKITIETIAIGDPQSAGEEKLDEVTLKLVAKTTGGNYSHAANRAELEAIYRRIDQLPTRPAPTITHRPRRDLFAWPLGIGLLISFVSPILGLLRDLHRASGIPVRRQVA